MNSLVFIVSRSTVAPVLRTASVNPPILCGYRRLVHGGRASKKQLPPRITLLEGDLEEKFVKGRGPGGQKINKVRNCVQLTHKPTGISVACQDARELHVNRSIARTRLREKYYISEGKQILENKDAHIDFESAKPGSANGTHRALEALLLVRMSDTQVHGRLHIITDIHPFPQKIEFRMNGEDSKTGRRMAKIRNRKARSLRKSRIKHQAAELPPPDTDGNLESPRRKGARTKTRDSDGSDSDSDAYSDDDCSEEEEGEEEGRK